MTNQTETLLLQYKLSVAELHTLFTFVSAPAAYGLPNDRLFPKNHQQKGALFQKGYLNLHFPGGSKVKPTRFMRE